MSLISSRSSIRSQLLLGFAATVVLIAIVGGYGVAGLRAAGQIVVDTYDRPLMAINFTRAASFDFAEMRSLLLQAEQDPAAASRYMDGIAAFARDFFEDMQVAEQRLLTERERSLARAIRAEVATWNQRFLAGVPPPVTPGELDALNEKITHEFDLLIEYTAESSFTERQRAVNAIESSRLLAIAATGLALLLAVTTAMLLARRIVRPLSAAVVIAEHIAAGELATPIPPSRGDETGMLLRSMEIMQHSIREMMAREQEQKHSAQARLVDALETAKEGMVLLDRDECMVIANSQFARFFPTIACALVPGAHFRAVFDSLPIQEPPREVGASEEKPWHHRTGGEGEIIYRDGRWLHVSRTSTREGGWFLLFTDVTEMKEYEETLQLAKQKAEAGSEAQRRFFANMSHELRTPLNAIIGFSEIMAGEMYGPLGDPRYHQYAGDIKESGSHLLTIINSVLDLAKTQSDTLTIEAEPVSLSEVLSECARMVREQCARAELTLTIGDGNQAETVVMGDHARLRQIFLNLLSNSIKFSPEGGSIIVGVTSGPDGFVTVSVADTGIGMRPEDIPIALAPFGQIDSRLARRYQGTGLGLPLAKAFVEAHQGRFEIESTLGQGTTASVILPIARAAQSERAYYHPPVLSLAEDR
jgi:signal transduction histidine kinase/HAMP domain-containing protein